MNLPRWPIAVGLVATAVLGVALRGLLAGLWTVPGDFANLRHAHSHGGVYAIVFPLCVLVWRHLGIPSLGRGAMALYYAAGAASMVTFSLAGYSVWSIVASTIVSGGWLLAAYRGRSMLQQQGGALRLMPVGFLLVSAFIPPIALLARRDPAMANALAHSFLATLFLLIALPTALRRIGAADLDARIYAPSALLAAAYLGAWPSPISALGLVGVAASLTWTLSQSRMARVHRLAYLGFAVGSLALVLFGPASHHTIIGGLHYLLLGPLFMSLAPSSGGVAWGVLASAGAMGASLVALPWVGAQLGHSIASGAGVAWAVFATMALIAAWRTTSLVPERLDRIHA